MNTSFGKITIHMACVECGDILESGVIFSLTKDIRPFRNRKFPPTTNVKRIDAVDLRQE